MKKPLHIFLFICFFLFLTGCGTNKELEQYKSDMETFYSGVSEYDYIMNSVDPASDSSVQEILSALDSILEQFTWMASLTVPEEFSEAATLSAEASEYMTTAVSLYHQAFESDPFDSQTAALAKENYNAANQCALYILSILHGSVPDADAVSSLDVEEIPETGE